MKRNIIRRLIITCMIMSLFCIGVYADGSFGDGLSWNLEMLKEIASSEVNNHYEDDELQSSGDCGENLHWELVNGVLTISGTGDMIDFACGEDVPWYNLNESIIQAVVEQGITSIGNNAFLDCYLMEQVSLPEGLIRIGDRAFDYCNSLKEISLPASLQEIGEAAFMRCKHTSRISVAAGNTAYYSENNVLFDQSGAHLILYAPYQDRASYDIPEGVQYIETGAFFCAFNLERLTVPEGVYSIGEQAFQYSGLKEVYLPASLKEIGYYAFEGCYSLTNIWYNDLSKNWYKIKIADGDYTLAEVDVHFADEEVGTTIFGTVVASGRCGPDVYWQKDAYGILRIYGSGSTYDFQLTGNYNVGDEEFFPTWIFEDPAARRVIIESGVTRIGRGTFTDVPDVVKRFFHVAISNISVIYYTGTETQWQSFVENSSDSYNSLIENATVYVNANVHLSDDQNEEEVFISEPTIENNTVSYTVSSTEDAIAWFAVYDENNRFLSVEQRTLAADMEYDLDFTVEADRRKSFRLLILEKERFIPLCEGSSGVFTQ